jgi:CHAT domain-containing protein/Tfp pilus assembly protein PilF
LAIVEAAFGPNHPEVGRILSGVAELHGKQGDFATLKAMSERILTAAAETLFTGTDRYGSAFITDVLALLRNTDNVERDEAAESLLKRVIAFAENLGPEHPLVAPWLKYLADFYRVRGDYAAAEPLYQRALAIQEASLGPHHPDVAILLDNLAALQTARENYATAESLYQRALAIAENALGPEHPLVADLLANSASMKIASGHPEAALGLLQRALSIDERTLSNVFSLASERRKFAFLRTVDYRYELLLNLVVQKLPTHPEAVRTAMGAVLRWKGVVLDALARERQALSTSNDPAVVQTAVQLQTVASHIASLMWAGPGELLVEEYRRQLTALEAEREWLEGALARRSEVYAIAQRGRRVDIDHVASALEPGSILVEYVIFQSTDFQAKGTEPTWGTYRYVAFMLPAGQVAQPSLVDLGEADLIDSAVRALRRQMTQAPDLIHRMGEAAAEQRLRRAAVRLYTHVFEPLKSGIEGRTVLYIAPDGGLNLIPLEVVQDERGRYLIETCRFNYLSSGRDVLHFGSDQVAGSGIVVLADPDYSGPPPATNSSTAGVALDTGQATSSQTSTQLAKRGWGPLLGTRQEAAILVETFGAETVQQYFGAKAIEEVIKQLKSPRILHLATHGFFLDSWENPPWRHTTGGGQELPAGNPSSNPSPEMTVFANPLLRSGLVLAGANALGRKPLEANTDDGIMTALEISGLNLWGTDLVVLSACETGVGETSQGEGVFGLRRAFQLAGARTVIMSLWSIPDGETVAIMVDFYRRLKTGVGKAQALREAALTQLRHRRDLNGTAHPFFWGAFVAFGSPG